jgi:hypothetical protein
MECPHLAQPKAPMPALMQPWAPSLGRWPAPSGPLRHYIFIRVPLLVLLRTLLPPLLAQLWPTDSSYQKLVHNSDRGAALTDHRLTDYALVLTWPEWLYQSVAANGCTELHSTELTAMSVISDWRQPVAIK